MMHALSFRFSPWVGKLQLPAYVLIALLQRSPVLRLLATAESVWVNSSLGQVLKASAVVATMMGAVDTLAGATTFVTSPDNPTEATVGVPFAAVFAYTGGAATVGSYSISNLPPGLSVPSSISGSNGARTLNAISGSITGTPTQAGDYIVSITAFDDPNLGLGVFGSAASTYMISVSSASTDTAPAITVQPVNVTVTAGQPAAFSVTATGSAAPTYQWKKNAVNISGAINDTYTISATVGGDAGTYSVVVTNSVSSVTSNNATLTVNAANVAPSITTQPTNQTVITGQSATFSVTATGTPAPTYQWRKGGVAIAGATNSTYAIAATVGGDAGTYSVVATNVVNSVTSTSATLTVNPASAAPVFTTQPQSQVAVAGATVTFTAVASGTPKPTYQWQKSAVSIIGANSSSYSIVGVTGNDSSNYTVIATNASGSTASDLAMLTVIIAPGNAVISFTVE